MGSVYLHRRRAPRSMKKAGRGRELRNQINSMMKKGSLSFALLLAYLAFVVVVDAHSSEELLWAPGSVIAKKEISTTTSTNESILSAPPKKPDSSKSLADTWTALAEAFCQNGSRPETCDWIQPKSAEYNETIGKNCWMCGNLWGGIPDGIISESSSFSYSPRFMSLGCTGEVKVEAVYKVVKNPRDRPTGLAFKDNVGDLAPSNMTRCGSIDGQLWLPEDCTECFEFKECPSDLGKWYKDTMHLNVPKTCPPFVTEPIRPSLLVNPGQTLNVSSFTVESVA